MSDVYNVAGELTPDATGNYFVAGVYGGQPYYHRGDGAYFIWWYSLEHGWIISSALGSTPSEYWRRLYVSVLGFYYPLEGATGNALISETEVGSSKIALPLIMNFVE